MSDKINLLQVKNVSKTYGKNRGFLKKASGETLANRKVNLTISYGEIVGLVGESGCGKSTLGNIIAKLLKPEEGCVLLEGKDITAMSNREFLPYRSDIQMVFQDPDSSLNPARTIGWILNEAMRCKGAKVQRELTHLEEKLQLVGLGKEVLTRYPKELSGGQKQRVSLLLALVMEPKLIVADEAVSALDVSVQAQILNLIKDIAKKENIAFLFISHDLNVVYYLCQRIYVMHQGEIVEEGQAETIFFESEHPYTKNLFTEGKT